MASERDLELLDDYLSNRLNSQDKASFEHRLESDPDLKKELELQQSLVEGIKQARVAELKGMLQNIPVSTIPTGQTSLITKIGSLVVIGGIVATGLYFYFGNNDRSTDQTETVAPIVKEESDEDSNSSKSNNEVEQGEPETSGPENTTENKTEGKGATTSPEPVKKPNISVYDPTKESEQEGLDPKEQIDLISNAFVTSSIKVEIDSGNKSHSFHYMFKDSKLVLFGIQEDDLYEILEFIYEDRRTVFLFYKSNYYWLDINKADPTKLQPIHDKALLKKLKEYRGNN